MKNIKLSKKSYFYVGIISFILLLVILFFIYVSDYYHAELDDLSVFYYSDSISREVLSDDTVVYGSDSSTVGIIFYPGGKVDHLAYEPLVMECAKYGYLCVIVDMPFNLAVFDINRADSVLEKYPNIEKWYIGGHSLGGSMAASYVSNHTDVFSGLILLGSYSTVNLSNSSLDVLSIYGSEDKVLDLDNYNKYKRNLPFNVEEKIISGGCHAYFGMYGEQYGDGKCLITNIDQIKETMFLVYKFIG